MNLMLDRLLEQAHLFDDPATYEAGLRDAFDAMSSGLDREASEPAA